MRQRSKDNLIILSKISIAILQGICVLFIGLLISFIFYDMVFWPGLYIFVIMISLILLHEGLEAPTVQREVLSAPAISSYTTTHL